MTPHPLAREPKPVVVVPRPAPGSPAVQDERARVASAWQHWLDQQWGRQCLDGSQNHGAFDEHHNGWYDGRYSAFMAARLIAVRCWPKLISFDAPRLDQAIIDCLKFVLRRQTSEGYLDLGGAPAAVEAGFPVPGLVEAWRRMADCHDASASLIRDLILQFVRKACEGLLTGPAMTANHRWAACCAALASAHSILPDDRYIQRIDYYLADGIDCDEDGCWFHERSAGYNSVANHGLLEMAHHLDRPDLLDHVVRNLHFTLLNIQPDNTFDSSYSFRQDRGHLTSQPTEYAIARRVAQLTGDGRFTTLAHLRFPHQGPRASDLMPLLFELDRHPAPLPPAAALPTHYEKWFAHSQLARVRRGPTALTLSADRGQHFFDTVLSRWHGPRRSEDWFHLRRGLLALSSIQLAVAGGRSVQPEQLVRLSDRQWRLTADRPMWQHPQHFRPGSPSVLVDLPVQATLLVTWHDDHLLVDVDLQSRYALAASMKIWIGAGAIIHAPSQSPFRIDAGSHHVVKAAGDVRATHADESLTIRGLPRPDHQMPLGTEPPISTSLPRESGCLSVGLTLPVHFTLRIE